MFNIINVVSMKNISVYIRQQRGRPNYFSCDLDDLDELEVYGADTKGIQLASYSFEVRL